MGHTPVVSDLLLFYEDTCCSVIVYLVLIVTVVDLNNIKCDLIGWEAFAAIMCLTQFVVVESSTPLHLVQVMITLCRSQFRLVINWYEKCCDRRVFLWLSNTVCHIVIWCGGTVLKLGTLVSTNIATPSRVALLQVGV